MQATSRSGRRPGRGRLQKIGNCFQNQFELPVLFYLLVMLAIMTHKDDLLFVILSWVFVASRLGHAFIHTGSNVVRVRGAVYGVGLVVLIAMWIIFAVRVLVGSFPRIEHGA